MKIHGRNSDKSEAITNPQVRALLQDKLLLLAPFQIANHNRNPVHSIGRHTLGIRHPLHRGRGRGHPVDDIRIPIRVDDNPRLRLREAHGEGPCR